MLVFVTQLETIKIRPSINKLKTRDELQTIVCITALACFYLQIPVGHVVAGLQTYNIYSTYPDEFNRHAVASSASTTSPHGAVEAEPSR